MNRYLDVWGAGAFSWWLALSCRDRGGCTLGDVQEADEVSNRPSGRMRPLDVLPRRTTRPPGPRARTARTQRASYVQVVGSRDLAYRTLRTSEVQVDRPNRLAGELRAVVVTPARFVCRFTVASSPATRS